MNMPNPRILLIEDDEGLASALERVLIDEHYTVDAEFRGDSGLTRAQAQPYDVVITDLKLPGLDGLELVRQLHLARPRLPIILMTAHGTTETVIEATKLGAYDYLLKPFEMAQLLELMAQAVNSSRLMSEPVDMGEAPLSLRSALIGSSRLMQELYKEIGRVAGKSVNVLVRGETGTGKELVARALYQHSERAQAPFVAVNCAAIPETLLESELFGHERGAYTGADIRRIGRFEQATGGTLFLDEIGDLSPGTQAKLLRVLQERCVQRLGGKEVIPVDVRVIAATHRDLEEGLRSRLFREDLYFRLSVVVITVPPLRQHPEDVSVLVRHFLRRYGEELGLPTLGVQTEALEALRNHPWPGNVRELENVVRQTLLLARGYPISLEHVRQVMAKSSQPTPESAPLTRWIWELVSAAKRNEMKDIHRRVVEEVERELFTQAIEQAQGNQAKAARWLGVSRLTMREKLHRFGVHPVPHDSEPATF